MTTILNSNDVNVQKKKDSCLIKISNTNIKKNKILYNSLLEIENINTKSHNKCLKTNICSIEFKAYNVSTLKNLISNNNYLNYLDLISLFTSIKTQLDFLFKNNIGILFFNINDIIAVQHSKTDKKYTFFLVNSNFLFNIENNNLIVTSSFDKKNKDIFLSPELLTLNSIPFEISYKSCYFSLSLLISFCIEGKKIDFLNPISWNVDDFNKILEPIDNTKLYWALLRCQEKDPNDRYLLLI